MSLFSISVLTSIAIILGATFVGIRTIYTQNVVQIAEQQSVSISRALITQEQKLLTGETANGVSTLRVLPGDFSRIDKRMRDYLQPFNIVKIKAFSKQMEVIYSTDPNLIGKRDIGNIRLDAALNGKTDAKLETKDEIVDLAEEARLDVDVVETYVPVSNSAGDIIGSIEIYMDVTRYRDRMAEILSSSMIVISLILASAFGLLYAVMRSGIKRLNQYEDQLHAFATTDVLTGVANRRCLLNRADEAFSRVQSDKRNKKRPDGAGYILIDLDHFKNINDTHGHQVGDEILKDVAERFKHCVRRYDTVGRYGGEEFLIITPDSDFADVQEIAERVWREARARPFEVGGLAIDVTVSVGFAWIEDGDVTITDVIKRADDSLYRAKALGRDQIAWLSAERLA